MRKRESRLAGEARPVQLDMLETGMTPEVQAALMRLKATMEAMPAEEWARRERRYREFEASLRKHRSSEGRQRAA